MALELAQQVLPPYSHPKSPHQFTQPQLLACLIVKAYLRQSYRGIVELLALSDGLRRVRPQPLVADAGYGAECVHEFCRERWRVNSWIPWQRLDGKGKCNHRLRLRPTRHPAGSVWSEWPSAITPLEGVVNDPCSELAASDRKGQVRGRWRSQMGDAQGVPSALARGIVPK